MKLVYLLILAVTESALGKTCPRGYTYNKTMGCIDDNECEDPICVDNAECFNTIGSYYCQCREGYWPPGNFTANNSIKCQDINECLENSINCGSNAKCINVDGNYICVCNMGYTPSNGAETFIVGQEVECIDRDECQDSDSCGKNASCQNTPGKYYCRCAPGFRLKTGGTDFTGATSESCESVCDIDASICGEGSCKIGKDGHECVCKSGFTNYGHNETKCTDLPETPRVITPPQIYVSWWYDLTKTTQIYTQAPPELTEIFSLMTNSCLLLNESTSVKKSQVDAETILKAFLDALDKLLSGSFQADNRKVSAIFDIVEVMLKLIGPLLKKHQTRISAIETEVELLVKRGVSPPEGPLMISTNRTQFNSHWKTATGKTYRGFTTAALLGYKNLEKSLDSYYDHLNIHYKINSKVVTATVSNTETNKLEEPITLTFTHLEHLNKSHICVFWDPELNGGAWSTRGCTKVKSSDVETVCSCDHLSSFAVLMSLYDIGDIYELHIITYVGLSLSLICLLLCIATFYLVRSIQSTRNTIHLHLCITLFMANLIFLLGITRTENKVGCAIVAGTLHYFFLAAFCWMCLEGVQLFRMVVLVFNTTVRHIHLIPAGYGVPAVIVVVSAIVNSEGYGTAHHCWLNIEDGFIWSFYGPVCIIIIVNVFFFLITIWKLAEKFSSLNPDLNNLRKIRTFTITAIAQLCVLGIMWVFGCFQFDQGTLAMSYIFTILGSLQGVLMFIMHCWLSKQVREEYVTFLSRVSAPHKRKYSEFNSQKTSKSQTSKSVQNTGESSI